jgi:predicted RNA-binding protein
MLKVRVGDWWVNSHLFRNHSIPFSRYEIECHSMIRWLATSTRENADVVMRKEVWGVPKKDLNQINRIRPGDTLLLYVGHEVIDQDITLPPAILGCFEIVSSVYEDTDPIFTAPRKLGNEVFPLRFRLRTIAIFEPPVEFRPLIRDLRFITEKTQWPEHIGGQSMRAINEEDHAFIMRAARTPRD